MIEKEPNSTVFYNADSQLKHTCFHARLIGAEFALSILFIVTCKTSIHQLSLEKETQGSSGELDSFL